MERRPGVWRLRAYMGTENGKPIQAERTFKGTKTAALKELRTFVKDVNDGHITKRRHSTVEHLLEAWLEHGRTVLDWRPKTYQGRESIVRVHLVPAFGDVPLHQFNAAHIAEYYAAKKRAGMKAGTIALHHQCLTAALNLAVKWDWVGKSPMVHVDPPKVRKVTPVAPAVEVVRQLIEAAGDDDDLASAVALAAVTGARRGELCGLQWADIDWSTGLLNIQRQRLDMPGQTVTGPLKSGERRLVALDEFGLSVLKRYYSIQLDRLGILGLDTVGEWVFSYDCGRTPIRPNVLGEQISALGTKTGVKVTTHSLRRFSATQMIGAGVDPTVAADRLGHTVSTMLKSYVGKVQGRDQAAAEALGALMRGEP